MYAIKLHMGPKPLLKAGSYMVPVKSFNTPSWKRRVQMWVMCLESISEEETVMVNKKVNYASLIAIPNKTKMVIGLDPFETRTLKPKNATEWGMPWYDSESAQFMDAEILLHEDVPKSSVVWTKPIEEVIEK